MIIKINKTKVMVVNQIKVFKSSNSGSFKSVRCKVA